MASHLEEIRCGSPTLIIAVSFCVIRVETSSKRALGFGQKDQQL